MPDPVKIQVLDREFLVACPDDEKGELLESAAYLSERMREIRDSGKVVGAERIAVMAALNITHEMLQARRSAGASDEARERLARLDDRIADFLESAGGRRGD